MKYRNISIFVKINIIQKYFNIEINHLKKAKSVKEDKTDAMHEHYVMNDVYNCEQIAEVLDCDSDDIVGYGDGNVNAQVLCWNNVGENEGEKIRREMNFRNKTDIDWKKQQISKARTKSNFRLLIILALLTATFIYLYRNIDAVSSTFKNLGG